MNTRELTPEQKRSMDAWGIPHSLKCGPYTEEEKQRVRVALRERYRRQNKVPPEREVFGASPGPAVSLASWLWDMHDHPEEAVESEKNAPEIDLQTLIASLCEGGKRGPFSHAWTFSRAPSFTIAGALDTLRAATSGLTDISQGSMRGNSSLYEFAGLVSCALRRQGGRNFLCGLTASQPLAVPFK
jgi:hypothetical protein